MEYLRKMSFRSFAKRIMIGSVHGQAQFFGPTRAVMEVFSYSSYNSGNSVSSGKQQICTSFLSDKFGMLILDFMAL